ncbi:ADP-ribosylglycohydrolase family protein [Paraflavitalea sp. CAU 1676]|uniref:ADP-ribosylglycohydrolase family protein n=1 Tax=Paraflavitalea sp. CAU 1676 TaxID=3032598 RepID=UPI0023D9D76B|nr:ADP-ribosylglycohydrolase family protein [Paraflavitalea sp. CAU 1676]MDF2191055.1 ADP-ribosylglycohydrolase family protein [Paraflavitalea sp. CAU 1676]
MTREHVYGALFGVAIGDALGVPAEFMSRASLKLNPIKDFVGYRSHNQPPGTFSDDSSLTFCLAASLCRGFDLEDIGKRFVDWQSKGYWTAGGNVFDIGMTTSRAINRLKTGARADLAGDFDEDANGNGSLMRILPLLFHIKGMEIGERYRTIMKVSSITHGHVRSVIACFYYLEFALRLLNGKSKTEAYAETAKSVSDFLVSEEIVQTEIDLFAPLLVNEITQRSIDSIHSHGYVMHTIEASMYCFMTTDNYQDAVLMAVNLGSDADTTAAVTGGLAGLYYGHSAIPSKWLKGIRRSADITDLCELMYVSFSS